VVVLYGVVFSASRHVKVFDLAADLPLNISIAGCDLHIQDGPTLSLSLSVYSSLLPQDILDTLPLVTAVETSTNHLSVTNALHHSALFCLNHPSVCQPCTAYLRVPGGRLGGISVDFSSELGDGSFLYASVPLQTRGPVRIRGNADVKLVSLQAPSLSIDLSRGSVSVGRSDVNVTDIATAQGEVVLNPQNPTRVNFTAGSVCLHAPARTGNWSCKEKLSTTSIRVPSNASSSGDNATNASAWDLVTQTTSTTICTGVETLCLDEGRCLLGDATQFVTVNSSAMYARLAKPSSSSALDGINGFRNGSMLVGPLALPEDMAGKMALATQSRQALRNIRQGLHPTFDFVVYIDVNAFNTRTTWVWSNKKSIVQLGPDYLSVLSLTVLRPDVHHVSVRIEPSFCPYEPHDHLSVQQQGEVWHTLRVFLDSLGGEDAADSRGVLVLKTLDSAGDQRKFMFHTDPALRIDGDAAFFREELTISQSIPMVIGILVSVGLSFVVGLLTIFAMLYLLGQVGKHQREGALSKQSFLNIMKQTAGESTQLLGSMGRNPLAAKALLAKRVSKEKLTVGRTHGRPVPLWVKCLLAGILIAIVVLALPASLRNPVIIIVIVTMLMTILGICATAGSMVVGAITDIPEPFAFMEMAIDQYAKAHTDSLDEFMVDLAARAAQSSSGKKARAQRTMVALQTFQQQYEDFCHSSSYEPQALSRPRAAETLGKFDFKIVRKNDASTDCFVNLRLRTRKVRPPLPPARARVRVFLALVPLTDTAPRAPRWCRSSKISSMRCATLTRALWRGSSGAPSKLAVWSSTPSQRKTSRSTTSGSAMRIPVWSRSPSASRSSPVLASLRSGSRWRSSSARSLWNQGTRQTPRQTLTMAIVRTGTGRATLRAARRGAAAARPPCPLSEPPAPA